jgi:hypothetical protein
MNFFRVFWILGLTLTIMCGFSSCGKMGKRGAPVPPRERIDQRAVLSGFQRGNQVILSWPMPVRNAPAGNVQNISRVDVYRLAEPLVSPIQLSQEEFADRSTLITTIPVSDDDFGPGKTLLYKDTLQFAGQAARLRYAIRFVNASGQKAAFSNAWVMEPTSKVAGAPSQLSGQVTQEAIRLTWKAPGRNVDASPVNIIGYNVYRSSSKVTPAKRLNASPIAKPEFTDEFFEFGKSYFYFVRAVSTGLGEEPVESMESNVLDITPLDTFSPSAPSAITLAGAPGMISIFFAVNPEKDIAGYRIYRSTDPSVEKARWQRVTGELWKTNTFQDSRVETGKRYYYYILAIDTAGNVSVPSEVVSEVAP